MLRLAFFQILNCFGNAAKNLEVTFELFRKVDRGVFGIVRPQLDRAVREAVKMFHAELVIDRRENDTAVGFGPPCDRRPAYLRP